MKSLSLSDLVKWLFTPQPAPWDTPGSLTPQTGAIEVASGAVLLSVASECLTKIHVVFQWSSIGNIVAPIIIILVANVLRMAGNSVAWDEAVRTTAWVFRCNALALLFLTGIGLILKTLHTPADPQPWYAGFFGAWLASNLIVVITAVPCVVSNKWWRDAFTLTACIVVSSFALYGMGTVAPKNYFEAWWQNIPMPGSSNNFLPPP